MEEKGWDPHINRLLSTWFDPNFVGGFLAFTTCILFGIGLFNYKKIFKKPAASLMLAGTSIIVLCALYLTYSRSAYLACGIGIITITALRSKKLLLLGGLFVVLSFSAIGKVQTRFLDLWESFQSIIGLNDYATLFNADATSRLRLTSWQNAISIIKENPIIGVGYNSFKYAQWKAGLIDSLDAHSATGSDSTILTIFATTGILGLIAYLWFYIKALIGSLKNSHTSGYHLGLTGGLVALLIHSTFVNSLLFPHLLVFFWISLALSIKIPSHSSS
jgi:O-antigen ligase